MKKIDFIPLILILMTVGFLTSCDPTTDTLPEISISETGSPTYMAGSTITFAVAVSTTNKELKTLKLNAGNPATGSGYQANASVVDDGSTITTMNFVNNVTSATVNYDYIIPADVQGNVTVTFTVTDDGGAQSDSHTFTIGGGGTAMVAAAAGCKIYNKLDPSHNSGWNLVGNVSVTSTSSDADLYNNTEVGGTNWDATYGFVPSFWTKNGTLLVKTTGLSYETATLEQVVAAYNAGTKESYSFIGMTGEGTIYAVRIRGGNTYAILKVTAVDGVSKATTEDFIQFDYKKATSVK